MYAGVAHIPFAVENRIMSVDDAGMHIRTDEETPRGMQREISVDMSTP